MSRIVARLAGLAAIGLVLLLVAGWFQNIHPAFDSFSHFRHLFAALLFADAFLLLFVAPPIWSLGSAAVLAVTVWLSAPYLPWSGLDSQKTAADTIRVLQFNLRFNNTQLAELADSIRASDADVVLLQEVTRQNIGVLSVLKDSFPHQLECSAFRVGSVALLSRFPLVKDGSPLCSRFEGFLSARLAIGSRKLTVASFHSKWPWPGGQEAQLAGLADRFANLPRPAVLAGDFNAAPWSAAVQRVARQAALTIVPGLKLTWRPRTNSSGSFLPALLSLDQIMASSELLPVARDAAGDSVSDHLPVMTEFVWRD